MSVCNKNTVCLGEFCSCGDITVSIPNIGIGNYTMVATFNGVNIKKDISVTVIGQATVPNIFNENYVHYISFIDEDGNTVNDSKYAIKTKICIGGTYTPPIPNNDNNVIIMKSVQGFTITNNDLKGRMVAAIIIDDYIKNIGFTKNINDNFITFTDGTSLVNGQSITILLA